MSAVHGGAHKSVHPPNCPAAHDNLPIPPPRPLPLAPVVIPSTVIRELDGLKTRLPDARRALAFIHHHASRGADWLVMQPAGVPCQTVAAQEVERWQGGGMRADAEILAATLEVIRKGRSASSLP